MRKSFEKVLGAATERFDPGNHSISTSARGKRYGLTDVKHPIELSNIPNSLDRPRQDVKLPLFCLRERGR